MPWEMEKAKYWPYFMHIPVLAFHSSLLTKETWTKACISFRLTHTRSHTRTSSSDSQPLPSHTVTPVKALALC